MIKDDLDNQLAGSMQPLRLSSARRAKGSAVWVQLSSSDAYCLMWSTLSGQNFLRDQTRPCLADQCRRHRELSRVSSQGCGIARVQPAQLLYWSTALITVTLP